MPLCGIIVSLALSVSAGVELLPVDRRDVADFQIVAKFSRGAVEYGVDVKRGC